MQSRDVDTLGKRRGVEKGGNVFVGTCFNWKSWTQCCGALDGKRGPKMHGETCDQWLEHEEVDQR